MACERYLEINGTYICLDIPRLVRKFKWPPDPPEWFRDFLEEVAGPQPDPWRGRTDILDGIRLAGVEQGAWSRDITRIVAISDLVQGFEAPELREQFAGLLRSSSDELLQANAPELRVELNL